jgi:hypothetical protein
LNFAPPNCYNTTTQKSQLILTSAQRCNYFEATIERWYGTLVATRVTKATLMDMAHQDSSPEAVVLKRLDLI